MTTDKDLEDLLRLVRLSTTAEQDERILGDALAAIDQSAVFPLRTLARGLRRHWLLSMAAAGVLVLLVVLPLALPRTPVEDSGRVPEVAVVTESPVTPAPPTHGADGAGTMHAMVRPAGPLLKTRGMGTRGVLRSESTTHHAPALGAQARRIATGR